MSEIAEKLHRVLQTMTNDDTSVTGTAEKERFFERSNLLLEVLSSVETPAAISHVLGGERLDKATENKLREALRFSASRSVITAEDERRIILSALSTPEVEG